MRKISSVILIFLFLVISCTKDLPASPAFSTEEYTVAVLMPLDGGADLRWSRISDWFQENLEAAQDGLQNRIKINIEWIEENSNNEKYISSTAEKLAKRDDVVAVIGPYSTDYVRIVAQQLIGTGKLMIVPSASSAEVLREYSGQNFFWALCEPDITECEVLLTKAQSYGAGKVALIADDTTYGRTFIDWFAFQASEMGMEVSGIFSLDDLSEAMEVQADYYICVPEKTKDIISIIQARSESTNDKCGLLFSGYSLDPSLLNYGETVEMIEGTAPYADPESGFAIAYNVRFDDYASMGEAQFYDALLLSALAIQEHDTRLREGRALEDVNADMNDSLKSLMSVSEQSGGQPASVTSWSSDGLYRVMHNPMCYNISGASGSLDFDITLQSSVISSVYCHWMIYKNRMVPLDYLSSDGSNRTTSTTAAWEWRAKVTQIFDDIGPGLEYADMESQWAVLICGSRGWFNYRHESDVLNMYNLLRSNGFDDDHIILIADPEEIATDSRNLYYGEIRGYPGGPNLYINPKIDYDPDDLYAKDICRILRGDEDLPVALKTDEHSNILLYWSGHGEFGRFRWDSAHGDFSAEMLHNTIEEMSEMKRFRKMLICAEPCFSGSVVKQVEGVPGVLGIASANSHESSFADVFDTSLSVWLSDRFSNQLIESIKKNPRQTFRSLYLTMVHNTYGSHVTIVNYSLFDNLYKATPYEFFYHED